MNHLLKVLNFGWPYMRRYWTRLLAAILLGVLFGLSNASFLWVTRTLFARLDTTPAVKADAPKKPIVPMVVDVTERLKSVQKAVDAGIDPWLPKLERDLDWKQALGGLLILPFMVAVSRYIGYLTTYCSNWVSEHVCADLRVDVLEKLNTLSLDYFNRSKTGDLLTRISTDTSQIQRCMSLGVTDLIKEPLTIVCVLTGLCLMDAKLTFVAVVFLPVCFIPLIFLGRKVRRIAKANVILGAAQSGHLVETLASIRVVKAFGLEPVQNERYRQSCRMQVHYAMKTVQAKELINPIIEVISMLGLGFLIVFIFYTHTPIPTLITFLTGVIVLFTPVKKLAGVHVMFQQGSVAAERLLEVFGERPSVKEPTEPKAIQQFDKALVFENVSFSYGNKMVLENINLKIPRGFRLGIAGESGCGKSTLVNLIFRFYDPVAGSIKIEGLDLRDVSSQELRQFMALVSQEVFIFDQTVAENIACGKKGATREEVFEAAKNAFAHDFIMQLPQGYDTRVGERGVTLSGGQRQRLAIARAFVRNAPILVLDEATAALDSQSESEVQLAIDRLEENRTVICIAHRLSTLANMDHLVILSKGRIVEQGGFQELLKANGNFAEMARRQGINA